MEAVKHGVSHGVVVACIRHVPAQDDNLAAFDPINDTMNLSVGTFKTVAGVARSSCMSWILECCCIQLL